MKLYKINKSANYYYDIHIKGKRLRKSTGTSDKKLALACMAKAHKDIYESKVLGIKKYEEVTLVNFVTGVFTERHLKHTKSEVRARSFLKRIIKRFGDIKLSQITYSMVEEYQRQRREKAGVCTANKELGLLKSIYNKANLWNSQKLDTEVQVALPEHNPVKGIKFDREPTRERVLTVDEIKSLIANATTEYLRDWIIFALNTGLRSGEMTNMCKPDIEFAKNRILLPDTKSGEPQYRMMNGIARGIVEKYIPGENDKPFGSKPVNAFNKTRKLSALPDVRILFHLL